MNLVILFRLIFPVREIKAGNPILSAHVAIQNKGHFILLKDTTGDIIMRLMFYSMN